MANQEEQTAILRVLRSSAVLGVRRLYGVTPADPAVNATAIALLLAVVFLASLIPARTASRANPVDVLRAE